MSGRLPLILCSLLAASAFADFGAQAQRQKKEPPGAERGSGEDQNKRGPDKAGVTTDPEKKGDCHDARTVVVRVILRANRKVTDIEVDRDSLKGLPEARAKELAEKCRKAASGIKFEPAVKDGHPVSQHVRLEYTFCMEDSEGRSPVKK